MSFYSDLGLEVLQLLTEFGQAVTITRNSVGSYDPATGSATVTTSTQSGIAAVFDYKTNEIDGTLIKQGDKKLLLSAYAITAPSLDDLVLVSGTTYTIKAIKETNPAGTVLLYECNVRV